MIIYCNLHAAYRYVLIIVLNSSVQIFKDITILYRIVYDIEILLKAELNLRNNGVYRQNRIFYNAILPFKRRSITCLQDRQRYEIQRASYKIKHTWVREHSLTIEYKCRMAWLTV